jgi:hypothetical protein
MNEIRSWMPLALSIATAIVAISLVYSRIVSRLDLIEYRLSQIEKALNGRA